MRVLHRLITSMDEYLSSWGQAWLPEERTLTSLALRKIEQYRVIGTILKVTGTSGVEG